MYSDWDPLESVCPRNDYFSRQILLLVGTPGDSKIRRRAVRTRAPRSHLQLRQHHAHHTGHVASERAKLAAEAELIEIQRLWRLDGGYQGLNFHNFAQCYRSS